MRHPTAVSGAMLFTALMLGGCATQAALPEPRPIVVYSGQRIQADADSMAMVSDWLTPTLEQIDLDPTFLIRLDPKPEIGYPWTTLAIVADTASLDLASSAPDAQSPYLIYGFLELMETRGTLGEVLPEAADQSDYGTERAILDRIAEVWLLGRSVYDTHPFGPLDELVYSDQSGFLDEFIFATQGERFADAATEYRTANPGRQAEFESWFRETFEADGPRYLEPVGAAEEPEADAPADATDGGASDAR